MNLEETMNALRRLGIYCLLCMLGYLWHPLPAFPEITPATSAANTERDGQHDFDFEIGTWKSHISRRLLARVQKRTAWRRKLCLVDSRWRTGFRRLFFEPNCAPALHGFA
jgi:hypothetical protein